VLVAITCKNETTRRASARR